MFDLNKILQMSNDDLNNFLTENAEDFLQYLENLIIENKYILLNAFIDILIRFLDYEDLSEIEENIKNFIIEFKFLLKNRYNQTIKSSNNRIHFYFYLVTKDIKCFEVYLDILSKDDLKPLFLIEFQKIIETIQDYKNLIDLFKLLNFFVEFHKDYGFLRNIFKIIKEDLKNNFEKRRNRKILRKYLKSQFGQVKSIYREIIKIFKVIYCKEQEFLQVLNFEILDDILNMYYDNNNQEELLENSIKDLIFTHEFILYKDKSYFNKLSTDIYNIISKEIISKWRVLPPDKKEFWSEDLILISKFLLEKLGENKKSEFIKDIFTTYNVNFDYFEEILNIEELYPVFVSIFTDENYFSNFVLNLMEIRNFKISNLKFLIEKPFHILEKFEKKNFTSLLINTINYSENIDSEFSKYIYFLDEYKEKIFDLIDHLKLFENIANYFNISWHQIKHFLIIFDDITSKYELEKKIKIFYILSKIFFEIERLNFYYLIHREVVGDDKSNNKFLISFSTPKKIFNRIFNDIISKLKENYNIFFNNIHNIGTILSYFICFDWFLEFKNISLNNETEILEIKNFFHKMCRIYSLHYFSYFQELILIISLKLDELINKLTSAIYLNREFIKIIINSKVNYFNDLQSSLEDKYIRNDRLQDFISNIRKILELPINKIFDEGIKIELNFIIVALENNRIILAIPILLVVIEKLILNFLNIICPYKIQRFYGFRKKIEKVNTNSFLEIKYKDGNPLWILNQNESNKLKEYYQIRNDYFHSDSLPSNIKLDSIIVDLNNTLKLIPDIIIRNFCLLFLQEKKKINTNYYIRGCSIEKITDTEIIIKIEIEYSISIKKLNKFIKKFTKKN